MHAFLYTTSLRDPHWYDEAFRQGEDGEALTGACLAIFPLFEEQGRTAIRIEVQAGVACLECGSYAGADLHAKDEASLKAALEGWYERLREEGWREHHAWLCSAECAALDEGRI